MDDLFFADAAPETLRILASMKGDDLQARVGAAAFAKAEEAQRNAHVSDVEWIRPEILSGRVRLGGISPRAQVRFSANSFTTQCACLLAGECEHVAALLLHAHALVNATDAYAPGWDEVLDSVLGDESAGGEPLALHLEYSPNARDMWLVPMRPGTRRPWVTKRAGWNDIISMEWGSVTDGLNPQHLGILREIYRVSREGKGWNNPGEVPLSSLGQRAFWLLKRAQMCGITLICDLYTWEEPTLAYAQRQVFYVEQIHANGIDLRALAAPDPTTDHAQPPAECRIANIDVCHGGTFLRGIDTDEEEDPFVAAGKIFIPAGELALYLSEYAPRIRARYHQLSSLHEPAGQDQPPNSDTTPTAQHAEGTPQASATTTANTAPAEVALVGRLEPWHQGRDVRLTWWTRYTHQGHTSESRVSGSRRARWTVNSNANLKRSWEALTRQINAQSLPVGLWPDTQDAWTMHHWDFPAYLLSAFEELIIAATTVEGLEWDLSRIEGLVPVNDAPMRIQASIRPSAGQVDWFDLSATIRVAQIDIPLSEALRAVAAGEEHLFISGQWVNLDNERIHALREAFEQCGALSADPRQPQLSRWQAHMWQHVEELADQVDADAAWKERIHNLPTSGNLQPLPLVESRLARLRPYQMEGHYWLTSLMRAQLGGILADDMGLGKTLQMLAAVASLKNACARKGHQQGPILVVAPTSVASTWLHEAQRWYPHLRVNLVRTTSKVRTESISQLVEHSDVVVTTYSVLRLDAAEFAAIEWGGCVLDEAHMAKNPRTSIYRSLRDLTRQWTIALTGTPVENSLSDLWALLSLTSPGLLPAWQRFRERFLTPIDKYGDQAKLEVLRRHIAPFMLRRTKEAVATDLPHKSESVVTVPLEKHARHVYERMLMSERARILGLLATGENRHVEVLSAMTRLRQAAIDPVLVDSGNDTGVAAKTSALLGVLEQILPAGHQALVFSQFTAYLDRIGDALDAAGIGWVRLDGSTRDRDRVIRRFQTGEAPVFLISLKAGGTGLTLTEADYVFVMDPWWNPAAEAQAIDRAHRIGQTKPVTVYRLVSEATIEEKVVELQEKKRALVDMLVGEDTGSQGRISADDIRALLA